MDDASCGKNDGFSWRRVDATCEQTFPYLLLALFSKEREEEGRRPDARARARRHPIGYPRALFIGRCSLPLNGRANDSPEEKENKNRRS